MKKLICLVLSAVLALGTLSLFAGCAESEVKDKTKKAEVLAAFDSADASAFDMSMETSLEVSAKSEEETSETTATERMEITAYEENNLVFGDMYMTASADSSYRSESSTNSETSEGYAFAFARGNTAYAASGEWKDRGVKAGNFDALVEDYRNTADPLSSTNVSVLFNPDSFESSIGQVDPEEYLDLATKMEGKVLKTANGYRIEYDFVEGYRNIAKALESAAPFYEEHPACTVSELFEAAGIAGFEDFFFLNAIYDESGLAEAYIGPSESFVESMKDIEKNTEKKLLRGLFSLDLDEDDKGSFTFKVSAELDDALAFKSLSMPIKVSAETDTEKTKAKFKIEVDMNVKALSSEPALRSLTGLTVEAYRPVAGTYQLQKYGNVTALYDLDRQDRIYGDLTGSFTVDEAGTAVFTFTFTGEDEGCLPETETWTVDLAALPVGGKEQHVFFTEYMGKSYVGLQAEVYASLINYEILSEAFAFREITRERILVTL